MSVPDLPASVAPLQTRLLCVPVTGGSPEEMQARSLALLPSFTFQEYRFDYLANPQSFLGLLKSLLQAHPELQVLATCRPQRSGGHFQGSGTEEVHILHSAAAAGARIVDLSLETAEELGPDAFGSLREYGAAVLLSFHDFQKTEDPAAILARMRPFQPDLYKIVPTAQSLDDSLSLLQTLRTSVQRKHDAVVAIAMGEPGLLTRVLGPRFGSAFTFGAATEAEATAPGQLTAQTLTDLYRIAEITPSTHLYGVAGDPIRSSLSPLMHNTAFRHTAVDAVYLPLKTSDPKTLFHAVRDLPLAGVSVTMPLKQTILPFLDDIDPMAARIGAVNTVVRQTDGSLHGFNTDVDGIVLPLERRLNLNGTRVLILGAGGAARAAAFACLGKGAQVFLCNRTQSAADALAEDCGAVAISPTQLAHLEFDVLIHATPAGMRGQARSLPLDASELRANLVFDLVYNPLDTPLLALARAKGLEVIPGIEMFLQQGARQFELWTGKAAPQEVMKQVVTQALERS